MTKSTGPVAHPREVETPTLTLDELPALRALSERATPGPWRTMECSYGGLILLRGPDDGWHIQSHLQIVPAEDADFISAARAALPRALDTLEAQAAEIAALRAENERLRDALTQGSHWFWEYEDEHRAKGADEKAERNRTRAAFLARAALGEETKE